METKSPFMNGARLVRRHLRLVVWIFVVNVILAWLGSAPARTAFSPLLDHSLASRRLVEHFDIGLMIELVREPAIQIRSFVTAGLHFSLVFLLYMIFINGGVLTVYREDRKLTKAEFFEMSGGYFWRTVRLVLLSFIPFAILGGLFSALSDWSDKLTDDAANAHTGFWVLVVGGMILWIATLFVRAWFDLAQSMTVAQNDRGMLRNTWRALVLALHNAGTLTTTYLSIHIVGIVSMIVLCGAFLYVPHASFHLSFFLLEIVVFVDIAVRLWQKAACMSWLESRPAIVAAPVYEPPAEVVLPADTAPEPF